MFHSYVDQNTPMHFIWQIKRLQSTCTSILWPQETNSHPNWCLTLQAQMLHPTTSKNSCLYQQGSVNTWTWICCSEMRSFGCSLGIGETSSLLIWTTFHVLNRSEAPWNHPDEKHSRIKSMIQMDFHKMSTIWLQNLLTDCIVITAITYWHLIN